MPRMTIPASLAAGASKRHRETITIPMLNPTKATLSIPVSKGSSAHCIITKRVLRIVLIALFSFLGFAILLLFLSKSPDAACAETLSDLQSQRNQLADDLSEAQDKLDQASNDYDEAMTRSQEASREVEASNEKITSLSSQEADIQQRVNARSVSSYKDKATPNQMLLDAIGESSNISDMIGKMFMISSLNKSDAQELQDLKNVQSSLEEENQRLTTAQQEADDALSQAQSIQQEAQSTVNDISSKMSSLDDGIKAKVREQAETRRSSSSSGNGGVSGSGAGIPSNGSVVDYAVSRLGCPYVWAASGPNSFDCSGLVMWCYSQVGKSLPHNSESLYSSAKARIPISEAEPGDVLYRSGHVGIYVGNGQAIHAPTTGDVVRYTSASSFNCALRF